MSDAQLFKVDVELRDDQTMVRLEGELDSATCLELDAAFERAAGTSLPVEVDLSSVSFIDSAGLRSLVVGHDLVLQGGQPFRVGATSAVVDRIIEVTGLTDVLGVGSGPRDAGGVT